MDDWAQGCDELADETESGWVGGSVRTKVKMTLKSVIFCGEIPDVWVCRDGVDSHQVDAQVMTGCGRQACWPLGISLS